MIFKINHYIFLVLQMQEGQVNIGGDLVKRLQYWVKMNESSKRCDIYHSVNGCNLL